MGITISFNYRIYFVDCWLHLVRYLDTAGNCSNYASQVITLHVHNGISNKLTQCLASVFPGTGSFDG